MKRFFSISVILVFILTIVTVEASYFDPEGSLYDEEDLLNLSQSGHRPASLLNFNKYEVGLATSFSDLAYKAENPNPQYAEDYRDEIELHGLEGYKFNTFQGETGHTAITNYFVSRTVMGFVAESEHSVYVAFRGSISKADYTTDLYVWTPTLSKAHFNGNETGKVHVGFCKTFDSCKQPLTEIVMNLLSKGKRSLIITGHSMGGALANLAALYFAQLLKINENHATDIKLVTFNSPRIGSKNFASHLEGLLGQQNIIRFTVGTREGASTLMFGSFGFKHAGTNVVVQKGTLNKLLDHRMYHFLNGNAVQAFMHFNAAPKKALGIKSQISSYQLVARDKLSSNTTYILEAIWRYLSYKRTSR